MINLQTSGREPILGFTQRGKRKKLNCSEGETIRAFSGNRIPELLIHRVAGLNQCAALPVLAHQIIDNFDSLSYDVLIIDWWCWNPRHAPKAPCAAGKWNCKFAPIRGFRAAPTIKNAAKTRRESGIRNALQLPSQKSFGFIGLDLAEEMNQAGTES